MKTTPPSTAYLILLILLLVPVITLANPKGKVNVTLEWHSNHMVYTYVFTGVVSHEGQPCPNAKIQLQVTAPNQDDVVLETVAGQDGSYEIKVSLEGVPQDSADWKLVAQGPEMGAQASEVEGRTILTEDTEPVVVQRPIQLIQG